MKSLGDDYLRRSQLLDKIETKFDDYPHFLWSSYSMKSTWMLYDRKWEIQYGGLWTWSTHNSACRHGVNKIYFSAVGLSMLFRSSVPVELSNMLHDQTGSWQSKIVTSKPGWSISQLVDMIGTQFWRLFVGVKISNRLYKNVVLSNREA